MSAHTCQDARAQCLDALPGLPSEGILGGCAECTAWAQRQVRLTQALGGLERLAAPEQLEDRLFDTDELDARPTAELLRGLAGGSAPSVLDRLVEEELADPAGQRARRFIGDLERLSAPAALGERLPDVQISAIAEVPRRKSTRMFALVGVAAAACVLVWASVTQRPNATPQAAPTYSFTVKRATSAAELDPIAVGLVHGLTGVAPGGVR